MADTYDLRGLSCPMPVLKTQKRLKSLKPGDRLWVRTSDPLAVIDIPHWCRESGNPLIESEKAEDGHRFLIECGAGPAAIS